MNSGKETAQSALPIYGNNEYDGISKDSPHLLTQRPYLHICEVPGAVGWCDDVVVSVLQRRWLQ